MATGSSANLVVQGAEVKCDCGSAPSYLIAPSTRTHMGNDINILDTDTKVQNFFNTFGNCSADYSSTKTKPCKLNQLLGNWFGPAKSLSYASNASAKYMKKYKENINQFYDKAEKAQTKLEALYVGIAVQKDDKYSKGAFALVQSDAGIDESGQEEKDLENFALSLSYLKDLASPETVRKNGLDIDEEGMDEINDALKQAETSLAEAKKNWELVAATPLDEGKLLLSSSVLICKKGGVVYVTQNGQFVKKVRDGEKYWEIGAFLPGTVLRKGAEGRTVRILQYALQDLYESGYLSKSPFPFEYNWKTDSFDSVLPVYTIEALSNVESIDLLGFFGNNTQAALDEYISKGIAAKDGTSAIVPYVLGGVNCVNNNIWDSLGLKVGKYLSDLFVLKKGSGRTVRVSLAQNTITIEYRPTIFIQRHHYSGTGSRGFDILSDVKAKNEPILYEDFILATLSGVLRWSKDVVASIQGVPKSTLSVTSSGLIIPELPINVIMCIYDKNGKLFVPVWDSAKREIKRPCLAGYNFIADSAGSSTVLVETNYPGFLATMVPDLLAGGWDMNKKLQIHRRTSLNGLSTDECDTFEHEFGHVLGLFDAYGYKEHFLGGDIVLPPADIDGVHVTTKSVMYCKYINKPFIRTETDWKMLLLAWMEGKLQNYIERPGFPKRSQAYFY